MYLCACRAWKLVCTFLRVGGGGLPLFAFTCSFSVALLDHTSKLAARRHCSQALTHTHTHRRYQHSCPFVKLSAIGISVDSFSQVWTELISFNLQLAAIRLVSFPLALSRRISLFLALIKNVQKKNDLAGRNEQRVESNKIINMQMKFPPRTEPIREFLSSGTWRNRLAAKVAAELLPVLPSCGKMQLNRITLGAFKKVLFDYQYRINLLIRHVKYLSLS